MTNPKPALKPKRKPHAPRQPIPTLIMQVRPEPLARVRWEWRIVLDVSGKRTVLKAGKAWGAASARRRARHQATYLHASLITGWQGTGMPEAK